MSESIKITVDLHNYLGEDDFKASVKTRLIKGRVPLSLGWEIGALMAKLPVARLSSEVAQIIIAIFGEYRQEEGGECFHGHHRLVAALVDAAEGIEAGWEKVDEYMNNLVDGKETVDPTQAEG